jgi:hypothetical protein
MLRASLCPRDMVPAVRVRPGEVRGSSGRVLTSTGLSSYLRNHAVWQQQRSKPKPRILSVFVGSGPNLWIRAAVWTWGTWIPIEGCLSCIFYTVKQKLGLTILHDSYILYSCFVYGMSKFVWEEKSFYFQNYWVFGLCPSSVILKTGEHNVSEIGSVSIFRWVGDTYSVGPLTKIWPQSPWPSLTCGRKQTQFPKRCVLWFLEY